MNYILHNIYESVIKPWKSVYFRHSKTYVVIRYPQNETALCNKSPQRLQQHTGGGRMTTILSAIRRKMKEIYLGVLEGDPSLKQNPSQKSFPKMTLDFCNSNFTKLTEQLNSPQHCIWKHFWYLKSRLVAQF